MCFLEHFYAMIVHVFCTTCDLVQVYQVNINFFGGGRVVVLGVYSRTFLCYDCITYDGRQAKVVLSEYDKSKYYLMPVAYLDR